MAHKTQDHGHTGALPHTGMTLANAHPHQAHSVGYEEGPQAQLGETHGIDSFHVEHGRRQKGAEHHPPQHIESIC